MSIITISREFGSGGREIGKRLADVLGYAYYDREIVTAVAQKYKMDEQYVSNALERGLFQGLPIHFGRTFSYAPTLVSQTTNLFVEQHNLMKELADQGNCIIVGRAAGAILRDYNPFRLFIYADMSAKLRRCRERMGGESPWNQREMERKIRAIDAERARYHSVFSDHTWGDKAGYHLCINTTDMEINGLIPVLAAYISCWKK